VHEKLIKSTYFTQLFTKKGRLSKKLTLFSGTQCILGQLEGVIRRCTIRTTHWNILSSTRNSSRDKMRISERQLQFQNCLIDIHDRMKRSFAVAWSTLDIHATRA